MKYKIFVTIIKIESYSLLVLFCIGCNLSLKAQNFIYAKGLKNPLAEGGTVVSKGIQVDHLGNTYITGNFSGTVDFDPGAGTVNFTSMGGNDIFIAKYNASGNFVYAKALGGTQEDISSGIALDGSGHIFITGYFSGTCDFDPGASQATLTSNGYSDIFFARYDSSGNYVYAKSIGSSQPDAAFSIATDGSGNFYITGSFYLTIDFDPGPDVANLTAYFNYDIFIARYDAFGNYVYAKNVGSGGYGYGITVDGAGNTYMTGGIRYPVLSPLIYIPDIIIAKSDASGNNLYTKRIGSGNADVGYGIAVDRDGNTIVTGYFSGTVDFDPGLAVASLTSVGGNDIFLASYDASGNYLSAKNIGGTGNDTGNGITVDGLGRVYVTGSFTGTADFDPGPESATLTSAGEQDIFIACYDASGNYLYAKALGGTGADNGAKIVSDNSGKIFVTGTFTGTVDFDPGPGTVNLTVGGTNTFITSLKEDGAYAWAIPLGNYESVSKPDQGRSIAADAAGNIYVTGYFSGTVDFDPGTGEVYLKSTASENIFIAKYDASGNYIYAKAMAGGLGNGDRGNSIALDNSGNIYITGSFDGTVDFDPGMGVANLQTKGFQDIFIAKYDASGNYVYAISIGSPDDDYGNGIAVDGSGNVYVTGGLFGTADFDPGPGTVNLTARGTFIAKYNNSGDYVYANAMQSTNSIIGKAIAVDGIGNAYVTGLFSGTVDLDPGTGVAMLFTSDLSDAFIAKYTTSGSYVYAKAMGGAGIDIGYGIAVDAPGNAYVTGSFSVVADFDPGAGIVNLTSSGSTDIFIARYDAAGNYIYAKALGGTGADNGYGIRVDGSGNVYVTGSVSETVDFDPGPGIATLTGAGNLDVFIAKYNDSGNYVYAKVMGGTLEDMGYGIAVDAHGFVSITGSFGSTANFDPGGNSTNSTITASRLNDVFIARYGPLAVLPVNLLTFTAKAVHNGDKVQLNWSTASQTNSAWFEAEHSKDGVHFEPIGRRDGCYSCSGIFNYELSDNNPYPGVTYYRVKQVDIDRKFSYSPIVLVNIANNVKTTVQIYPTITDGFYELRIKNNLVKKQVMIRILNATGSMIKQEMVWLNETDNRLTYNLSAQAGGVYYISIIDKERNENFTVKIVKK